MAVTQKELDDFHRFASEKLATRPHDSVDQLFAEWKAPRRSNFIWYFFASAFTLAVLVILMKNERRQEMSYSEMFQLIVESERDPVSNRYVDGKNGTLTIKKDGNSVTYSNLRGVKIGPTTMRAKVDILMTSLTNRSEQNTGVAVYTTLSNQQDPELIHKLQAAKINTTIVPGPSFWDRYGFFFIIGAVFVCILVYMMQRLGKTTSLMFVDLPQLREHIEAQISAGRYKSVNDYLVALIRADKEQQNPLNQ